MRVAGDVDSVLPPSVLKNIGDKLYEKRKQAALEVEQVSCSGFAVSVPTSARRMVTADMHLRRA